MPDPTREPLFPTDDEDDIPVFDVWHGGGLEITYPPPDEDASDE